VDPVSSSPSPSTLPARLARTAEPPLARSAPPPSNHDRPLGVWGALALGALTILGGVLRFTNLGDQSFWADEAFTGAIVQGSLGHAWRGIGEVESAPPLYYLLQWAWAQLVGTSDSALRSLSALSGTLTIPVMFAAGYRLAGQRAALAAAALTACSPMLVWYSQEARVYSLYVLFSALSFWFFLRAREDHGVSLAAWAVASAAAIATHYFAALLVACEAVWLLTRAGDSRRRVAFAVGSVAAVGVALIPYALPKRNFQDWILSFRFEDRISELPQTFVVGVTDPPVLVFFAALGVVALGVVSLVVRGDGVEKRHAALAASFGVIPLLIAGLAALAGADLMTFRNLLVVWVPFAVAISIAFTSIRARALGAVLATALCILQVGLIIEMKSDERLQRINWRAASELIGPPRDRVILAPDPFGHLALFRYLSDQEGRAWDVAGTPRTTEVVLLTYQPPERGSNCYIGNPCSMPSPDEPPRQPPPGFHLVERLSGGLFRLTRYRAPAKRPVVVQRSRFSALVRESPEGLSKCEPFSTGSLVLTDQGWRSICG
jgi:mannosyltransferase